MPNVFRSAKTSKFGFEEGNRARCFRKHSVDRFINNLSVRSLATLKSEVYGGIRLHAHLRATTETIEGYPSEYCAVFYLSVVDSLNLDLAWQRDFKQSTSSISGDTEFFDITNEGDNLDKSMFVGIINISEKRQRRVPCLIRLQTLDDCPLIVSQTNPIVSNALGFSGTDIPWTIASESTFTITDREVDRLVKSGILENPELPEQMVKRGTQVVAGISNEHRKLCRDVFKLLKLEHALSCITISYNIVTDSVGLTLQKLLPQVINDLTVFICSAEFEKRAIQRVHNSTPIIEVMIDATLNISYIIILWLLSINKEKNLRNVLVGSSQEQLKGGKTFILNGW